jgi:small subunit ribosomal protein S19
MAKKFTFRGKTLEELEAMSVDEFMKLLKSRQRRSLKHGLTKNEKNLLKRIEEAKGTDRMVRTKERDMVILPKMIGVKLGVYTGREFKVVVIDENMLGHRIGELAMTRQKVMHSSPGFGATRSSKFVPLK